MQMSQMWELVGIASALVVWGGVATVFLLPQIRRCLTAVSVCARQTPFRAAFVAAAVGIAVAYGGTKPPPEPPTQVTVSFDANGGTASETSRQVEEGAAVGTLPTATRTGYDFVGWFTAAAGGSAVTAETAVTAAVTYFAHWTPTVYSISYELAGGVNAAANPTNYTVESAEIALAAPTREGYVFTGWTPAGVIPAGSTGDRTFTADWEEIPPGMFAVTFDANGGTCEEKSRQVEEGAAVGELPTATRTGYDFVGWFTAVDGGDEVESTTVVEANMTVYAHWTPGAPVGRYLKLDLADALGIVISNDVDYALGDKVTVKVEGLAKGLKLVATQQKETTGKKAVTNVTYTIEGVPTEEIDFETRPMYARVTITYKDKARGDKGKVESLQPIVLSIAAPEPAELTEGVLNQVYGPVDIATLWPEVADAKDNPKDWSFKGWPAGLKYANGVVSGKPTKAGEYPITATYKHLIDGKSVSETFSAVLTVWGDDGATDFRYTDQAYVATATKVLPGVTAASGLPTGIKFTKNTTSLAGMPTKAGVFAVTLTKTDKSKETFLWKVAPPDAPTFALDTGTAPFTDLKAQIVQGANQAFAIATSDIAAKVTASGLPSGLKLVQDKTTGLYSVEGIASKPGEYFVTFKTTLNGVTTVTTTAFTVKANPFAVTYCGYTAARPAAGAAYRLAVAEVTVAAAGTVKLTYTEGKTKYTASVKSFEWSDATGKGTAEGLVLKASSADKQHGYGDRKATVTFENYGVYLRAKLDIADADGSSLVKWDEAFLYATVKMTEVPLPASQTYVFRTKDSENVDAIATVSVASDAKKATAAFSGKLFDGTAVKATVPVIRVSDDGTSGDYAFAPFLVIAKDGTVICFENFCGGGGYVDLVREDGEHVDEIRSTSAQYALGDKKFAELVPATGAFTFGWGSDAELVGETTESFAFEVTFDKNKKPAGVAISDADPQPGEKPLVTVTAKVGKTTGAISVSFTSKKGDKAKYAVELVWRGEQLFAGHVTRTWKELVGGKSTNLTACGTAEVK